MAVNPFVDHVKIYFRSGNGGPGAVSWRKEKYVPKGGPDGGDGGKGGSIIFEGNPQLWTLLDLRYRKHIRAEDGQRGSGQRKTGRNGKDEVIQVPLGTVFKDAETGDFLGEIKEEGERFMLLEGGNGGRGNHHYKSSTNQTPEYAGEGREGRELAAILELKVLADVGLVGFPNAGKSTLLSVVSAAKPKIASYPFTTLVPNLGIVKYHDYQSFVMADIPGIIEGAHEGKGLGSRFLRHIERNSVLLYMVPSDSEDIMAEYKTLLDEVETFNPDLHRKQKVLAISKMDLLDEEGREKLFESMKDVDCIYFSSLAMEGVQELKDKLWKMLQGTDQKQDWEA